MSQICSATGKAEDCRLCKALLYRKDHCGVCCEINRDTLLIFVQNSRTRLSYVRIIQSQSWRLQNCCSCLNFVVRFEHFQSTNIPSNDTLVGILSVCHY